MEEVVIENCHFLYNKIRTGNQYRKQKESWEGKKKQMFEKWSVLTIKQDTDVEEFMYNYNFMVIGCIIEPLSI